MIDQSTFQTNFVGRDGFYWWIGRVAPIEAQGDQAKGKGWGNRYKVRIMGYHDDEVELPDKDLPWAQVLISTTSGSGSANTATSIQIKPNDRVVGFFLDGDNAQVPVITNVFPNQRESVNSGRSELDPQNAKLDSDESNEPKPDSQPTPITHSEDKAASVNAKSVSASVGDEVPLANTAQNTKLSKIKSVVKWLLKQLKKVKNEVTKIKGYIRRAVDKIATLMNEYAGSFMKEILDRIIPVLKGGLENLYKLVYTKIMAATGNPVTAHAAGVAAQEAMVVPVKLLEEQLGCVLGSLIDKLLTPIEDLLYSTLANVEKFVTCAADQFVGSLLNKMIGLLENLMSGPLALVEKILGGDFNVGDIAKSVIGGLSSAAAAAFDCNQGSKNFKGLANEWMVGVGQKAMAQDPYRSIQELTNIASSGIDMNSVVECFSGQPNPSPPRIEIFGGNGSGATAVPIFGNIVPITGETSCVALGSVIGAQITNGGSGYTFPPFIEIIDDADQGYGAIARTIINDDGEVTGIYMESEGEDYCVGDIRDYSVIGVVVEDGGDGYENGDTVTDNLGNEYSLTINDGQIEQVQPLNNVVDTLPILTVQSDTGNGALLRPLLGTVKIDGEIQTSIDCPQ